MARLAPARWQGRFFTLVFTRLAILLSLGMVFVGALTWHLVQRSLQDALQIDLRRHARLTALLLARSHAVPTAQSAGSVCRVVHQETDLRVTVFDASGRVLGDSDPSSAARNDRTVRPEVAQALHGGTGVDRRDNPAVGQPLVYVAVPVMLDDRPVAVVRVAASEDGLTRDRTALAAWIAVGIAIALALSLLPAWLLARALARPIHRVSDWASRLASGDLTTRVEVQRDDEIGQVAEALEGMRSHLAARVREAQQQRRNLEVILANLEEGVLAVDQDGNVLTANASARQLLHLGTSPVGGPLREQLGRRSLGNLWDNAVASGTSELRREIAIPGPDGDRSLDVAMIRIPAGGSPITWLFCLRDVTEVTRSAAMKAEFVANASHELRTPAASIRAAIDTLRSSDVAPEARERFLSVIDRNVARLQALTDDLMQLNRVDSATVQLSPSRFDPVEVFETMQTLFSDTTARKQAELVCQSRVESVIADRQVLELVIRNLVDNAVKFIDDGGRIELVCRPDGATVRFDVRDDGCGIPAEDVQRVFERFYQVDKSRGRNPGGTGLGLAIVKHAVMAMGGNVTIESQPGHGTTVSFAIPVSA